MNRLRQDFFTGPWRASPEGTSAHRSAARRSRPSFLTLCPPGGPPLALDANATQLLRDAEHRLGRLDLAGEMVPSIEWFLYAFRGRRRCSPPRSRERRLPWSTSCGSRRGPRPRGDGGGCRGGLQSSGCPRTCAQPDQPQGGPAALDPTSQPDAPASAEGRPRRGQTAGGDPTQPELDRGHAAGECGVRTGAA